MNDASHYPGTWQSIWNRFWPLFLVLSLATATAMVVPYFIPARTNNSRGGCIGNLKHIECAKESWAIEMKKQPHDTPIWTDLVGTNAYIKYTPKCPVSGEIYELNRVDTPPTCNFGKTATPPHVLPQ